MSTATSSPPVVGALNPKSAAEYLATTEGTLAKWRSEKVGPPYLKMRGKVLYRLETLDKYLRDLEEKQVSQFR